MRAASEKTAEPSFWFHNRQRRVVFDEGAVRKVLERLSAELAGGREFAVVTGSAESLRRANAQFRGKRGATDVLSFPDDESGRLGDILISAAHAEKQAREHGHSIEAELAILALHGLLHLLGYDHESDEGEMRRAEVRWRRKLGLGAGLIERSERH